MRRAIARGAVRRTPLRRGLLVAPRDTWPPFDGGVSMEPAGTAPDGSQRFRYVHSAAYQVRRPCVRLALACALLWVWPSLFVKRELLCVHGSLRKRGVPAPLRCMSCNHRAGGPTLRLCLCKLITDVPLLPHVPRGLCVRSVQGRPTSIPVAALQGVQRLFEEAQASHDPNNIMALLQHHPYHIDALMAMFELHRCYRFDKLPITSPLGADPCKHTPVVMLALSAQSSSVVAVVGVSCSPSMLLSDSFEWCRAMGQHEYADEMLQRCLYGLEMAWHPWCAP